MSKIENDLNFFFAVLNLHEQILGKFIILASNFFIQSLQIAFAKFGVAQRF